MKKAGIHLRLLLSVFALISATTFTLGYAGISISRQFIQDRFEKRIAFLAKYLALNAELGVLIDNKGMLNKLAANLMTEEDVAGVVISDQNHQEIIALSREVPGPFSTVQKPVTLSEPGPYDEVFQGYPLSDPVSNPEKTAIGTVQITYSTAYIEQILTVMAERFIWFSAGLACLAGLIFYFLSRSMVKPVTQLARVAREVADGDMALRVRPGGLPETRDLAKAFNAMLDSIKRNRDALEDAYQEIIQQTTLAEMGKFSLMVAHEVKNPLSIIKSSLDVLKSDPSVSADDPVIFYMEDEIERLNRMIEDFLAFARPGRPFFRQVDVSTLMAEIVEKFQLQNAGSNVTVRSDIPPRVYHDQMDPDMFSRVMTNILKNALEANGDQGDVHIRLWSGEHMLRIEVADLGEGIDEECKDRLFEPFFTTRSKGTGLGLAYASQVVQAHNGTITARNRSQKGACFCVEIPLGRDLRTAE
ncbi:MAG: HAMP domain-containing histidine kinase [Deltaproteobacteria bacterium]|nr:HAMP domain-containing histidine kinase [Deltaproteobacteria bacterium]